MKRCSRCKEEKDLSMFHRCSTSKDGLLHRCKPCSKEVSRLYRENNQDYFKEKSKSRYQAIGRHQNKERYSKYRGSYLERRKNGLATVRGRLYVAFKAAKDRSAKTGRDFDLTLEWLVDRFFEIGERCEVTGIKLTNALEGSGGRFMSPFNPSLDRIDSGRGYTKDNVRIVCVVVNLAINRFGDDVFSTMCHAYVDLVKTKEVSE